MNTSSSAAVVASSHPSVTELSLRFWQIANAETEKTDNVWLSPVSIVMAMQSVCEGAAGETRSELLQVTTNFRPAVSEQLKIADALFVQPNIPLKTAYEKRMRDLGADLYRQPITVEAVNRWASDHTNGKITKVLDNPLAGDIKMVIANAIYFCGEWSDPFNEHATQPEPFFIDRNTQVRIPMMCRTGYMNYFSTDVAQVVTLYYAIKESDQEDAPRYAMTIILPNEQITADSLLSSLAPTQLDEWLQQSGSQRIRLQLPKLTVRFDRVLNEDLRQMGVRKALNPTEADFTAMSSVPLVIDMVKQSSYLRMDERGTEAAAVTVAAMRATSVWREDRPTDMIVNRPYLLVLQEVGSHSPLFVGTIHNPQE